METQKRLRLLQIRVSFQRIKVFKILKTNSIQLYAVLFFTKFAFNRKFDQDTKNDDSNKKDCIDNTSADCKFEDYLFANAHFATTPALKDDVFEEIVCKGLRKTTLDNGRLCYKIFKHTPFKRLKHCVMIFFQ